MALTDNLFAHWKFDETGGSALDSSGNGRSLTNNNSVTYVAGKINNAANFVSASLQYLYIPSLTLAPSMSFSFWVYEQSRKNSGGNPSAGNMLFYSDVNYAELSCDNGVLFFAGAGGAWRDTGCVIPLQTWTHVTLISTSTSLTIYINGVQQYTIGTDKFTTLGNGFYIGVWGGYTKGGYFDGKMDDFRIYSRALTTSEITELASMGGAAVPAANTRPFFLLNQ